jgi:hypothetical protein
VLVINRCSTYIPLGHARAGSNPAAVEYFLLLVFVLAVAARRFSTVGTYVRLLMCRSRRLLYCHTHQAQQVAQGCMYYKHLNSDYDTIIHSTQYVQAIYTSISHTAFRPPNTTCIQKQQIPYALCCSLPLLKTRNPPHVSISSLSLGTSFLQERRRMACVKSCTYHESIIRHTVTPRLPHLSSTITRKLSSSSSL